MFLAKTFSYFEDIFFMQICNFFGFLNSNVNLSVDTLNLIFDIYCPLKTPSLCEGHIGLFTLNEKEETIP